MIKLFKSVLVFSIIGIGLFFQSCDIQGENNNKSDDVTDSIAEEIISDDIKEDAMAISEPTKNVIMPENFSVAYVNIDTLMEYYKLYKDASAEMKAYEMRVQNEYEYKAKKLKQDYDTYVSRGKAGLLSLQEQKNTEALLKNQQEDLMGMEQQIGQEAAIKRQKAVGNVTETIKKFLDVYREEKGFTMILQSGSMSGLLSASDELDITTDVLKRLNAKYEFDKKH